MTAPALYRYVDSYAQLLSLLAQAVFTDVIAQMTTARDAYSADDPAAQVVAASAAFRRWALSNPSEFRLVFATPRPDPDEVGFAVPESADDALVEKLAPCATETEGTQFAGFFAEIFMRLWQKYEFHVPSDDELHPAVLAALTTDTEPADLLDGTGNLTAGMVWTFERSWARLYGTVTLEVFGHMHPALIESGALFGATILDIGRDLGLADEWDRLEPIALGAPDAT
jgi:AcrR family transcriptional regulator